MSGRLLTRLLTLGLLLLGTPGWCAIPTNFEDAKQLLREQVYHDQNQDGPQGPLHCGCDWDWTGTSGGLSRCGPAV